MDDTTTHTYDKIATKFADATWDIRLDRAIDSFAAHLSTGAKILDLGCGPGRDIVHFRQLGFQPLGADLSPGMLQEAKRRIGGALIQCDMRCLSIADASFGGVWLCASLLHLPRSQALDALLEVRRVIHPGDPLFLGVQLGEGERWKTDNGLRLFTYYQPDELQELIEKASFQVVISWQTFTEYITWINLVALAI